MSSSLRKLPPEVARELRRHINPSKQASAASAAARRAAQQQQQPPHSNTNNKKTNKSNKWVVAGCVALTGTMGAVPLLYQRWYIGESLNEKDAPLTAAQVRRGAFMNSGSRDVGRDPDWDFTKGQHKIKSGYAALLEQETGRRSGTKGDNTNSNNDDDAGDPSSSSRHTSSKFFRDAASPGKLKQHREADISFATGQGKLNSSNNQRTS